MKCEAARPLIPLYIDGELTEFRASALRPHLLECPACRGVVQGAKALKTWFVPTEPVPVLDGFAAHVARRAFAGDSGTADWGTADWGTADRGTADRDSRTQPSARQTGGRQETPILQFVLQVVAVAAVVLITLSIAIRRREMPDSEGLRALSSGSESTSLRALDELNRGREIEIERELDASDSIEEPDE